MKTLLLLFACMACIVNAGIAQAPQSISYQAVARNNFGAQLQNQSVGLRFSIHDGSAIGTIIYRETQTTTTNSLGLFNVNIGQGTVVTGTFSSINWGSGSKFLQVELDATGGTSYTDMGTQQMLSVPYSLYSNSSGGPAGGDLSGTYPNPAVSRINGSPLGTTTGAGTGQVLKWNGTSWSSGTDNNSGGTVTSITAGSGLSGGTITGSGTISMPNIGTAGTYGSSTQIPVITTDTKGRVSNVTFANNVRPDTFVNIGEGDFVTKVSTDQITRYGNTGVYLTAYTDPNLIAPVRLPHGVTVTKITIYYIDDHPIYNLIIDFFRKDPSNLVVTSLANTTTSGINGAVRNHVFNTNIVIDNHYSYYLNFNTTLIWPPPPDPLAITGAKIEFSYP